MWWWWWWWSVRLDGVGDGRTGGGGSCGVADDVVMMWGWLLL